jgi:hypothetical protein
MGTFGSGAEVTTGHRLQPYYSLFSAPEGGEKTRLGGEPRREEQLIPRAGLSTDRDGTDDDLSEGGLSPAFPPSSGTIGVAQEPKSGRLISTSSG